MLSLITATLLAAAPASPPPSTSLQTFAEQSGFVRTGRYDEVVALCDRFAATFPKKVRCDTFGVTPEGRPMLALVASSDGVLTAEAARRANRPVVMAQGGIHAGEIDGKDAGFLVLRDLLQQKGFASESDLLSRFTFVFIPVLNVDGHERFGPNQRPNQRGPEETGWRVTSKNLNLNRDYVKADTQEMRHLLRFMNRWDPILYLDLHATNGAQFRHDVAVMLEPLQHGFPALTAPAKELRERVLARLEKQGHHPLPFYPSFRKHDDPSSGAALGAAPPRFSQSYRGARNRYGVLVETHSWRPYVERVQSTKHVLQAFMIEAAAHGEAWKAHAAKADAHDARGKPGEEIPLAFEPHGTPVTLDFLGYAYEHKVSPVSGAPVIRYDERTPQLWRIPYVEGIRPTRIAHAPELYVVPAGWADLVEPLLRLHGFRYDVTRGETRTATVERFRARETKFRNTSFEGRQLLEVQGAWEDAEVKLRPGTLLVPAAQPGRRLLVHLFEPMAPDSLLAWGFFNSAFEQKEYIEDYVLEPFARELLARDPKVRKAFEERLKDESFAKDPAARMRFFAERHPAWDAQLNVYPVYRARSAGLDAGGGAGAEKKVNVP